jgi:RHS repeat-associated protein
MIYSEAARAGARRVVSRYSYDGLGRRTLEREEGGETMRRLYDGLGFEEIRAGATFSDGSFTTRYATGVVRPEAKDEGMRYRWLGETATGIRGGNATGAVTTAKYTGIQAVLYARGEAVGMNLASSVGSRGGSVYLGKDILGSVRSSSGEYGTLEDRYEYDAFGKPYKGNLGNGMSLGYTGKPYDTTTGLYNYGYRDYKPEAARFTTVDPVRDGANWFAYVNNDPVNWRDPWGLNPSDIDWDNTPIAVENVGITIYASNSNNPMFPTDSTRITSTFNDVHPFGIDIGATTPGQAGDPVVAAMGGIVTTAGKPDWSSSESSYIIIDGSDERTYRYVHTDNISVSPGDTVATGQQISTMSDVGANGQVHLHFEVFEDGQRINPLSLYPDINFALPGGQ